MTGETLAAKQRGGLGPLCAWGVPAGAGSPGTATDGRSITSAAAQARNPQPGRCAFFILTLVILLTMYMQRAWPSRAFLMEPLAKPKAASRWRREQ